MPSLAITFLIVTRLDVSDRVCYFYVGVVDMLTQGSFYEEVLRGRRRRGCGVCEAQDCVRITG